MKKVIFVVFLIGFCIGQEDKKTKQSYKNDVFFNLEHELLQVGHINEFVLDEGHPFKKQSALGYTIIQQGKLKEFVLDRGYPFRIKPDQSLSNFKIISEY